MYENKTRKGCSVHVFFISTEQWLNMRRSDLRSPIHLPLIPTNSKKIGTHKPWVGCAVVAKRVTHDALQRVKPSKDALVYGKDCPEATVEGAGKETVPRAVPEVAPGAPSCQLRKMQQGGKKHKYTHNRISVLSKIGGSAFGAAKW